MAGKDKAYSTIGFYFPLSREDANLVRAVVNDLAAALGLRSVAPGRSQEGSASALLMALHAGQLGIVTGDGRIARVVWETDDDDPASEVARVVVEDAQRDPAGAQTASRALRVRPRGSATRPQEPDLPT